jgi:HIV Tat-specific factor 1
LRLQREPDGIVTIKFQDPIAAQACVMKNNNRFFGGRQLKAWLFDGKTRYRKTGAGEESEPREGETAEQAEKRRLEEFGQWLEDDAAAA